MIESKTEVLNAEEEQAARELGAGAPKGVRDVVVKNFNNIRASRNQASIDVAGRRISKKAVANARAAVPQKRADSKRTQQLNVQIAQNSQAPTNTKRIKNDPNAPGLSDD